jgi:hypothetical protein
MVRKTVVITQANGQVCILKLHHGNRRISLAEAEELLRSQGKLSAVSLRNLNPQLTKGTQTL